MAVWSQQTAILKSKICSDIWPSEDWSPFLCKQKFQWSFYNETGTFCLTKYNGPSWEDNGHSDSKKFLTFDGTYRSTTAQLWTLFSISLIHPTLACAASWRFMFKSSSCMWLGFCSLHHSRFATKILYAFLTSHTCYMHCPFIDNNN